MLFSSLVEKLVRFDDRTTFCKFYWNNKVPYVAINKKNFEEHFGKIRRDDDSLRKDYMTIKDLIGYCQIGSLKLEDSVFCVVRLRKVSDRDVKVTPIEELLQIQVKSK